MPGKSRYGDGGEGTGNMIRGSGSDEPCHFLGFFILSKLIVCLLLHPARLFVFSVSPLLSSLVGRGVEGTM